jgi:hypothetical protein
LELFWNKRDLIRSAAPPQQAAAENENEERFIDEIKLQFQNAECKEESLQP